MELTVPERLADDLVALRPMTVEDARPYAAAFREDPDLGQLLGIETDPDEESVSERIRAQAQRNEDDDYIRLAIADAATDEFWGEMLVHSLRE